MQPVVELQPAVAKSQASEPTLPEDPAAGEAQKDAEQVVDEPPPRPERVAILTPGGPLIVDVRFTINGRPHTHLFDELVQQVIDAGDSDGNKRSTWKEFVANRAYFEKQMQNAPAADSRQVKTFIERWDDNRDGRIQPAEAASWLGRDGGGSAAAFKLRSTRSYRPAPRATSQVWQLIDSDRDGRLSAEEAPAAPAKLLAFDADDDRILTPAEMASLREQLQAASGQRTSVVREASYYAAIHLEPDADIERVHYLMSELYSPQQDLGPASFRELSTLFDKLDDNGDRWLDNIELATMVTVEPHVVMSVVFEPASEGMPGRSTLEVEKTLPEVALAAQPTADRVVLTLGNTRIVISAHNLAPPQAGENLENNNQSAARSQVRAMVHDQFDAVFEELDANADGRLGEREIERCSESMLQSDVDGDRQLSHEELPYSMTMAFLLGEPTNQESFYVPPSDAIALAKSDVELPVWFVRADLNGDGDVSRREFVGSVEQFDRLDDDGDGYLSAQEAVVVEAK